MAYFQKSILFFDQRRELVPGMFQNQPPEGFGLDSIENHAKSPFQR